jgi:hypothetical protein
MRLPPSSARASVEVRRRHIAPRSKIRVLEVLSRRIEMIGDEGAAVADVVGPRHCSG